jgi:hypothetical protein
LESIHFLFDDVGTGADGPGEKLGAFQQGQTDFLKAVAREDGSGDSFDMVPAGRFWGQEVFHAPYRFDHVNTPKITKNIFLAFLFVFCKFYGECDFKLIDLALAGIQVSRDENVWTEAPYGQVTGQGSLLQVGNALTAQDPRGLAAANEFGG